MNDFEVRVCGARGTRPVTNVDMNRYGGNTTCFLVTLGKHSIILDGGTGIMNITVPSADILFGHYHLDHIDGFVTWGKLFDPSCSYRLYGTPWQGRGVKKQLQQIMSPPIWPVSLEQLPARLSFHDIASEGELDLTPEIRVRTKPLCHPNSCTGYRIEYGGKSLVYMVDHEDGGGTDYGEFAAGCDLLIFDASFTDSEYRQGKEGWGHSGWQDGVSLAKQCGVKKLLLTHHLPTRTDDELDEFQRQADSRRRYIVFAREGETITL